jgi:hypothetical protein
MTTININVKITAGKRTPVQVDVYSTSVNGKALEFANGEKLEDSEITVWLEKELTKAIKRIQDKVSE